MANRYWVGGTANWDKTAGTKWSLTDGGAGGQSVPTDADDVFFTASSGAVTVTVSSANRACKNLNFTGFTGTFAGTATISNLKGSLTLGSGMTLTHTGQITFTSTSAETITTNGILVREAFSFNGVGGSWTLQDNFTNNARNLTLINGTFNANNKNLTIGALVSNNSNTRTLTMGSGIWTLNGTAGWNLTITTGLTFNKNTANIIYGCTSGTTFNGGGLTYNDLEITSTGVNNYVNINGNPTFGVLKLNPGTNLRFFAGTIATASSLNAVGTSGSHIVITSQSTILGTISIPSGIISVKYCDISYSIATGGATFNAFTSDGNVDGGNNSGWNFGLPQAGFLFNMI